MSKWQECSSCKNSHLKCFTSTNLNKFHPEEVGDTLIKFRKTRQCLVIDEDAKHISGSKQLGNLSEHAQNNSAWTRGNCVI